MKLLLVISNFFTSDVGLRYYANFTYANFNDEKVKENVRLYNQASPLLCGNITSDDKITDRKVKSLKDAQLSFFE